MNDGARGTAALDTELERAVDVLLRSGHTVLAECLKAFRVPAGLPPVKGKVLYWGDDELEALPLDAHTLVMGIINVTPDSFSDGGRYLDPEAAVRHGLELVEAGADVLDIGGESTRPGAEPVDADEELRRVVPVIEALHRQVQVPISIDTSKAAVAEAALAAGASIVNDVTALRGDPHMVEVVVAARAPVVLMHMRGTPRDMQRSPRYESVVGEVLAFLADRVRFAAEAGVAEDRMLVDPGIGFGKTVEHNLTLLRYLRCFTLLEHPILLGTSRKSFIGAVLGTGVDERVEGTAATVAAAIAHGAAMVRVHDVKPIVRVARMSDALWRGWRPTTAYVGLGSNMGDREAYLRRAVEALGGLPLTRVTACSSIYETEPVGDTDQGPFLNMVVRLETSLDARRLLREMQHIEVAAGRVRTARRFGPRTLDLDLLLFGNARYEHPRLTVPHPRMGERGFVLVPLVELDGDIEWDGRSAGERLAQLRANGELSPTAVRFWGPSPIAGVSAG